MFRLFAKKNKNWFRNITKRSSTFPENVVKDQVKWVLIPSKIVLDSLGLWPENSRKNVNVFIFTNFTFILIGQIIYLKQTDMVTDFTTTLSGCAITMVIIEVLTRLLTIICNRENIVELLREMYYDFWPSEFAGRRFQNQMHNESTVMVGYCWIFTFAAFLSGCQYFILPLILASKELPLLTHYPFNWKESPVYELLYVWQSFFCGIMVFIICGFDLFFASLLWNCIGQFKILGHFFQTGMQSIIHRKSVNGNNLNKYEGMQFLAKFIVQHQKLLKACKKIEDTFTFFILTLVIGNIITVCLPSFLGANLQPVEFGKMSTFLFGHFCELLLYCFLGNALTDESTNLSNAIFASNWHLVDTCTDLKKPLLMIMIRSQKKVHITAAGFTVLSLETFLKVLRISFSLYTLLTPDITQTIRKHFGQYFPSEEELRDRISLLFVNVDPVFNVIRPLVPAVIPIGSGSHIKSSKPLPQHLERLLDSAENGVMYFSLGTNVKSENLQQETITKIWKAFKELPYRVLWKFDVKNPLKKPDNVVISKWFSQQDILRHPKVKLFITQGGWQSIQESIYSHVPMLGLPFFVDQATSMKKLEAQGLALTVNHKIMTQETFKNAIQELIQNSRYYHNKVKELAELARDQPQTGLEKAVWWTEYVIRHKGSRHLRSPALDLPFYQYYLLDVTSFCLVITAIATLLLSKLVKFTFNFANRFSSI